MWHFASVEKEIDAAKKDCTVVYKLVFLKTYLLQWRVYIGLQENLHPKKTFYVFQPHHYWQPGPYINVVVQVTGYTSSLYHHHAQVGTSSGRHWDDYQVRNNH